MISFILGMVVGQILFILLGVYLRRRREAELREAVAAAAQIRAHILDLIEAESAGDVATADQIRTHLRDVHGVEEKK